MQTSVLVLLSLHVAAELQLGKMTVKQLGDTMVRGMQMDHSMTMDSSMTSTGAGSGFGGEKMERDFKVYDSLPLGAAALKKAGWKISNMTTSWSWCNKHLGYEWYQPTATAFTRSLPIILYTTEAGQPSGVGVDVVGDLEGNPPFSKEQLPYTVPRGFQDGSRTIYRINVAFRKGEIMCDGSSSDAFLGDTLIVNPGGKMSKEIPLTEDESAAEGWVRGSCFNTMGWHRFFDTSGGPFPDGELSWKGENVFPVVAMYHQGAINAIFFNSWTVQQTLLPPSSNQWEPIPLPNPLMCKNLCSPNCGFTGTSMWSTMHIYFRDHTEVTCEPGLKCNLPGMGCCEASTSANLVV